METYTLELDGQQVIFNVVQNTTAPCPQCGVPACGRENILWYEVQQQRTALVFDGGYFDLAIEALLKKNSPHIAYSTLPTFIKEWNEARGWTDCWDYNGYALDTEDFLITLALLKGGELGKWITLEDINIMEQLATDARALEATLKIVCG